MSPALIFQAVDIDIRQRAAFIPHDGLAKTSPLSKLDQFAEHLANGLSVKEAAEAMGHDYAYGNAKLQVIRKRLGRQAV